MKIQYKYSKMILFKIFKKEKTHHLKILQYKTKFRIN